MKQLTVKEKQAIRDKLAAARKANLPTATQLIEKQIERLEEQLREFPATANAMDIAMKYMEIGKAHAVLDTAIKLDLITYAQYKEYSDKIMALTL